MKLVVVFGLHSELCHNRRQFLERWKRFPVEDIRHEGREREEDEGSCDWMN